MKRNYVIIVIFLILIPTYTAAFGNYVSDAGNALDQSLDIAQLTAEKYILKLDEKSYDIYYGYDGSFEVDVTASDKELPKLTSMNVNTERKSLEITMNAVSSKSGFWISLPLELISTENAQYILQIDGVDTKYDLTKFPDRYALGMIIPENSQHIEIIGTKVIPEFGEFSTMVLGLSVFGLIYFVKKTPFWHVWTRIN